MAVCAIKENKLVSQYSHIDFCVPGLTCFISSDGLQKNSAKESNAGSDVKAEMVSACKKK